MTGELGTGVLGQDSWDRTSGTRQLEDSQERGIVAGKRQKDDQSRTGQDSKDRTTETGQP